MDLHTLHIEHAVLLGLFTLLTIVNSQLHRGTPGANWFPLYTFCAFVGAMLITLRGVVPDALSIFVGDLFFPLAYLCLHRSLTEFFDRGRYQTWLQLGLVGLQVATLLEWGILHPDTAHRLLWYSLLLSVQLGCSAVFVLRSATGPVQAASRMMGGLLALLSTNNLLRTLVALRQGAATDSVHGSGVLSWALLLTSVLQGAVVIAFVWMTAARLRQELEIEATTDPLTRLLNRRAVEAWVEREIRMNRVRGGAMSAILIDLDEFKQINDMWGHHSGDAVLLAVARCLEAQKRPGDRLARLGGDEFAVLLPRTGRREAVEVAERLRVCLEELRCGFSGMEMEVRASFGVAELRGSGRGWEQLFQHCDKALYAVKDMGGNGVLAHAEAEERVAVRV